MSQTRKKNKSSRHQQHNSQHISTLDKSYIATLIEKINKIGEKFEAIYTNPSIKSDKKRNTLIQALLIEYYKLRAQIPETYYPLLNNEDFNSIISRHPLFQLYKIAQNPTRDQLLIDSFKTNKDLLGKSAATEPFFTLSPTQKFLRNFLSPATPYRGLFIWHGTGVGKCHAPDTEIIMYDGNIKKVQDIVVGDIIMGTNSQPRHVLSLGTGYDTMYRVILHPNLPFLSDSTSDSFIVNSQHILVLEDSRTWDIINIELVDYLKMPTEEQKYYKAVKSNILWNQSTYNLAGDITNKDAYNEGINLNTNYKVLPRKYLINTIGVRTHYLAGIIDIFGIIESSKDYIYIRIAELVHLHKDIAFLARSIGLEANIHAGNLYIWGYCLDFLPFRMNSEKHSNAYYRKLNKSVENFYEFSIEKVCDRGEYFGFTLDGNHCYLLEDFTITHNTCTGITIAENLKNIIDMDEKISSSMPNITILRQD